jgi:carbamoyltransferase
MRIIGINTQHDGGCALLVDGKLECAISEERLTRHKGAGGGWHSLRYCLVTAGLCLTDIDLVCFSSYGARLPEAFDYELARFGLPCERCINVDHHLSHAYSSYFTSAFDEALILVVDGSGNSGDTESYYHARGSAITKIGGNPPRDPCKGIGKTYEAFTSFLGWTMAQSGNTMALAAYGDADRYRDVPLFDFEDGTVNGRLRRKYVQGVLQFAHEYDLDFGAPFGRETNQLACDAAAFVQRRTEDALIHIVRSLVKQTGVRNVCLAGGVALNCVTNRRLLDESGIASIHVVPAANDKGQSLGNVLFGYYAFFGGQRNLGSQIDSWGRSYSDQETLDVLNFRPELGNNFIPGAPDIEFERKEDIAATVARLVVDGSIVGWVQGGAELGPRALGQRSIVCHPGRVDVARRLSEKVKTRAPFRPYAPSVLEEYSSEYFDLPCPSPFMLLVGKVKPEKRHLIPAVVHVDDTARIQTVSRDAESPFRMLIKEFYALTGIPVILNTSFNRAGEPIVETPADALRTFLSTDIDYLALGNYLVRKRSPVRTTAG